MDPASDCMAEHAPVTQDAAPVLTILISSYNTSSLLADCLNSIYRHPPIHPYEIVVVDDASTDDTSEMVRTSFPGVRLIRNDTNLHYARANNRGMQQARGEYIMLLNSDTIVLPGAIDAMIQFLRTHPDAGNVGCKLINEDGSIQSSVKSLPNPGSALFGARSWITKLFPNNRFARQHLLHLDRDLTKPLLLHHGYVSGAASMMPRAVVDKVGYLDPDLFFHVDADHCKRIADAGYATYYLPTATIMHLNHRGGSMASPMVRFRALLRFEQHTYHYYRKHFRNASSTMMRALVVTGLSCHFLALVSEQACRELGSFVRRLAPAKRSGH